MNHKNGNRVHKIQNPLKACNAFKGLIFIYLLVTSKHFCYIYIRLFYSIYNPLLF